MILGPKHSIYASQFQWLFLCTSVACLRCSNSHCSLSGGEAAGKCEQRNGGGGRLSRAAVHVASNPSPILLTGKQRSLSCVRAHHYLMLNHGVFLVFRLKMRYRQRINFTNFLLLAMTCIIFRGIVSYKVEVGSKLLFRFKKLLFISMTFIVEYQIKNKAPNVPLCPVNGRGLPIPIPMSHFWLRLLDSALNLSVECHRRENFGRAAKARPWRQSLCY